MIVTLGLVFAIAMIIGVPIAFTMGITAIVGFFILDAPTQVAILQSFGGMDKISFLAIPFFVLAGELMNTTGITQSLVAFAYAILGGIRGSLAQVCIVASAIFASITGSATSSVSTLGSTMVPEMEKMGYDDTFTSGVIASASVLGPIIPPSILMIVISSIGDLSVGALFLGGFVPGILMAGGLMILVGVISVKRNYPKREEKVSLKEKAVLTLKAIPALMMPIIILGGVFTGVTSVTEAAAVAVGYSFVYGLVSHPKKFIKALPDALQKAVNVSVMIITIIAAAGMLNWVLSAGMVAHKLTAVFLSWTENPYIFLIFINLMYFILGCLMEPAAAILMSAPLIFPMAAKYGIDPLHLGLIIVVNLSIGFITPPVGLCLYTLAAITKIPFEKISRAVLPFLAVEVIALLLMTFIPIIVLWLPRMFGFI